MKKLYRIASLLAAILLATLPAAGCQPNPTKPPVVNKGDLENKIKDKTPAPSAGSTATVSTSVMAASTEAPRHQFNYVNGKLKVTVDAVLEQPQTGKLPVVKVAPREFTQDEVTNFIKVLFQGKQAYQPKDKMTKAEINQELIRMKAMKAQAKEGDKTMQKIDAVIAYYEEQLKTAPETVEMKPSDGKLKTDDLGNQEISVIADFGKTADANLSVFNSASGRTTSLWFTNEDVGESYMGFESVHDGNPKGVSMTVEEARTLAEKTVADLGSDLKLAWTGIGVNRVKSDKTGGEFTENGEAWLFAFTREVNGVLSVYESDMGSNLPQEEIDRMKGGKDEYIEPHPYERITMAINDTGIVELQWISPDKLLDTVSADVQTLPFEEIMATFEQQFFIHNALKSKASAAAYEIPENPQEDYAKMLRDIGIYNTDSIGFDEDVKSCTFTVSRISLSIMRIAVKDKENEFMFVPVYDFFGSVSAEYMPETGYAGFSADFLNRSFLTINAIDGSVINRSYGY